MTIFAGGEAAKSGGPKPTAVVCGSVVHFPGEDLAGLAVDLVGVFQSVLVELHLVEGDAVILVILCFQAGDFLGGEAGVLQGDGCPAR